MTTRTTSTVSVPLWLIEALFDLAREHRADNEWKRDSSPRNRSALIEMDIVISATEQAAPPVVGRAR